MLFLRLSEAQTCKWAVFATSWNLSSADCTTWHGVCSVLRLTSVNCTVFATFWNQHVQFAWDPQLFESNMCTWESARSILELGFRFFLPAVLLPSFPPSLFLFLPPVGIMSFFPVGFLFYYLFPLIDSCEGLGASVACNRYVNSSEEVSSPLPWLLHGRRECPQLLR